MPPKCKATDKTGKLSSHASSRDPAVASTLKWQRAKSLFNDTEPLDGQDGKQGGLSSSPYLPSILEAIQPGQSLCQRKANGG